MALLKVTNRRSQSLGELGALWHWRVRGELRVCVCKSTFAGRAVTRLGKGSKNP